jgi:hypothetical protein
MATNQSEFSELAIERSHVEVGTICCYLNAGVGRWSSGWLLSGDRLLAAQALQLLMGLDRELMQARADWNQDRFRRVMKARAKAVSRVHRRWHSLEPAPAIGLGKLGRRYHANLARYLYTAEQAADTGLGE